MRLRSLEHFAQRGYQHHHKNDGGQRVKDIHDAHQNRVHPSAEVTGHRAPEHADDEADHRANDADEQ